MTTILNPVIFLQSVLDVVGDEEITPISRLKKTMLKQDESEKMLNIPVEAVLVSDELIDKEFQQFLSDISRTGEES